MYKSMGGLSWTALFKDSHLDGQCSVQDVLVSNVTEGSGDFSSVTPTEEAVDFSILQSAQGLHESLTSLKNVSGKILQRKLNK